MSSLMMTGILLGGAGALAVVLRRRIEEWIAFAVLLAGVLLAGFAMADALTLGYAAVKYAGLAALAFTVGAALWKREYRALLLTPGALAFLAMMAIVWFGHRGRLFTGWDDFTHWGLAVKSAFQEGRLAPAFAAAYAELFQSPEEIEADTLFEVAVRDGGVTLVRADGQ